MSIKIKMMKKVFLLTPVVAGLLYITLSSSSAGGAYNSGADGTKATGGSGCSCHAYSTATTVAVELDSAGVAVTSYHPGMAYTIKLTGTNTGTTSLPYFGFQTTVVKASGAGTSAAVLAGTLGTTGLPAATRYTSAASCGIDVIEHSGRHNATTGTGATGTTYVISGLPWTAPAAGTGTVKVYGCINAVNGSGSGGDHWNNNSITVTEASATDVATINNSINVNVYPNPVVNTLNISGFNGNILIYDVNGKSIYSGNETAINAAGWSAGMYYIVLRNNDGTKTIPVVKQ